jgi:hypothetical protein
VAEVAHSHAGMDDRIGMRCRPPSRIASQGTPYRLSRPARPGKAIVRLGTTGRATTSDPGTRAAPHQATSSFPRGRIRVARRMIPRAFG